MVRSCSAPGCRSGRTLEKPKPSFFLFPLNASRRRAWAEAFPKSNYIPSKNSVLCEKHFRDDDFETMRKDSKESRRKQRGPLKNKKLKPGAIPSVWEDPALLNKTNAVHAVTANSIFMNLLDMSHPQTSSLVEEPKGFPALAPKNPKLAAKLVFPTTQRPPRKILPKPPILSSSSGPLEVNHKTNVEGDHCYTAANSLNSDEDHCYAFHNVKKEKWEEGDDIVSMYDFEYKIEKAPLPAGVKVYRKDSKYVFYLPHFQEDGNAKIGFSLELGDNFKYNAFVNGIKVLRDDIKLSFNAKITKISELVLLLEFLKAKSEGMPNSSFLICQAKKNLEKCVEISDEADSGLISKLLFLKEQCDLLLSKSHKYSDSLLSVALMWHQQAPTLYEQIRKDGVMTLPSASHLRRFTAFNAESGLPSNTVSYLRARCEGLSEADKVIAIVFDEVYAPRKLEFVRGRLKGSASDVPRTSFALAIKSVAGPYRDVVYTSTKSSIKAQTIYDVYMASLKALTDMGFRVVAVYSDGNPGHIHFFKDKIFNGVLLPSTDNPFDPTGRIHIVFEQATVLRNFYLSFLSKKILYCPAFDNFNKFLSPNFDDLKVLYGLEDNKSVKISHYLEDKCLSPSAVEKANFRLGCAVFHDSTIRSLECYSSLENDFSDTISFCSIVFKWWDLSSLKRLYSLLLAKDAVGEREVRSFLETFTAWLKAWKNSPSLSATLNPDICEAVANNAESIPRLASFLLELFASEGLLFQGMATDAIEEGLAHFSQFSGRNFNASVGMLLGSETKIRLTSLIKFSHVSIEPPDSHSPSGNLSGMDECVILKIVSRAEQIVSQSVSGDACLNFYLAGHIARCLSSQFPSCPSCLELIAAHDYLPLLVIRDDCEMESKEAFVAQIGSNVLHEPSDILFYTVVLANSFYQAIASDEALIAELRVSPHSETVFAQSFLRSVTDNVNFGVAEAKCAKGHPFRSLAEKAALHIYNIGARNHFEEFFNLIHCQIVRNGGEDDEEGVMEEGPGEDDDESETYIVETIEED